MIFVDFRRAAPAGPSRPAPAAGRGQRPERRDRHDPAPRERTGGRTGR